MQTSKSRESDRFPNIVYATVTETAANTLTFQQIQTGYGSLQKTGWCISRLEYYLTAADLGKFVDGADVIRCGLTTSNLLASLSLADASLIDLAEFQYAILTAVGGGIVVKPFIRDFSNLPGGGRLVLPYPLYLAAQGVSLATAVSPAVRIYFTEVEMADQEWMELIQQTRLLT